LRYIWRCKSCGRTEEVDRPLADIDVPPESGHGDCKHTWQRLIAPSSFILTGGGWFKQGYDRS
jgi:predicted nucleic acid-binding Zn ribbon protein